ncbi:MAG TPA: GNAT family N-acyltransferase [Candidatus Limnocylindria bacterium]|jgi:putative hemolysin|nr:GNAT family N-acyltransferase [Candidatus Limnocylindria bacterium]
MEILPKATSDHPTHPEPVSSRSREGFMGTRVLSRTNSAGGYRLRVASSQSDLHAAQTLRFLVFNLELNEGLESAYATLRDEDRFDAVCDHLLVELEKTGEVVGTYRLQTGPKALANLGFYSAQEFDFRPYAAVNDQIIELGRACVHRDHRNLHVLGLLWRGIADYARANGARYLIGCSSMTSQDTREGASAYIQIGSRFLVDAPLRTNPHPAWACPLDVLALVEPKIPKLLRAYLSLGARICGAPAIDREFKTIDFLTLLDLENLPAAARRLVG